jgi:hypothetical protein
VSNPLQMVGYFVELPHGRPDGGSLRASMRPEGDSFETELVAYLNGGVTLATTGRMTQDVLSDDPASVAPLATLTDGEWMWPADLGYYVAHYHIALPDAFVRHIAECGWIIPRLSDDQLLEAESRARSGK